MEKSEDVERLFSWLKAPMVHYREFAPEHEVAEAMATWPLVHKAAVQTGLPAEDAAPHGGAAARERLAEDRRMLPNAAVAATSQVSLATPSPVMAPPAVTPGRASDYAPEAGPADLGTAAFPITARVEQAMPPPPPRRFEEPPAPVAATAAAPPPRRVPEPPPPTYETAEQSAPRFYPSHERAGLFSGEYRGRGARPGRASADRQDRSLDAVFSRLSGARDRLPDPRERARTSPGLGPVFGRLR